MKKFLALLLALVMSLSLVACGGGDDTAADGGADAEDGGNAETAAYQVAMITDYGDITDQSFNQTTYEACQEFCDAEGLQFEYYKPAGDSTAERVAMVDAAVADGYNVIVMPGYAFAETIKETAELYPDVTFIALDVAQGDLGEDYTVPSNVYCAVYQEELCGYMAGYAAVKLGYTHLGVLGGMPATVENLLYLVQHIPAGSTWSAFGVGKGHLPILFASLALGGHIRVGMEDNVVYEVKENGEKVMATNHMLVERAVNAVKAFGNTPATPDEARRMLGIPAFDGGRVRAALGID